MNNSDHPSPPNLLRELGAAHAASIVVGVVIGSGIFLVPAEMMQAAGSAQLVYLAWILGGIFSFFWALTYAISPSFRFSRSTSDSCPLRGDNSPPSVSCSSFPQLITSA